MISARSRSCCSGFWTTATRAARCSSTAAGSSSRPSASSRTFDATAFATLTAADFSANDQLAKLIGETDFNTLFHQGETESMLLADVARRVILVVLFDNRTTLGLVRLKMRQTVEELTKLFEAGVQRAASRAPRQPNVLAGADDEIDKLFQ